MIIICHDHFSIWYCINSTIIDKVIGVHIRDEVLKDGLIDLDRVKPLARLGYGEYTAVDNVFEMTRPRS